jgi:hypothetical protein
MATTPTDASGWLDPLVQANTWFDVQISEDGWWDEELLNEPAPPRRRIMILT